MANVFTAPSWIFGLPHAQAERQVGNADPLSRADVINRVEKGYYATLRRLVNTLFDGITVDFTDQTTVSSLGSMKVAASILPATTDGAALGSGTLMFSDLFLAAGGVIDFNNGNYTATHSAGILTLSGQLVVSGTGPHAIGGPISVDIGLRVTGSGAAGQAMGMQIDSTTAPATAESSYGLNVIPTLVEFSSGLHPALAGINVEPTVTAGAGTLTTLAGLRTGALTAQTGTTNAAAIYVSAAPTGATNNYALWVAGGRTLLDTLQVGSGGTFTGQAYIKSAAAGTIGLVVDTAASPSADAQQWMVNTTIAAAFKLFTTQTQIGFSSRDLGSDVVGAEIFVGRNTNATPGAGTVRFTEADGDSLYVWIDNSNLVRVGATAPNNTNQGGGTVVGDQTSWHEAKHIVGPSRIGQAEALSTLLATQVYDFAYRDGAYNGRIFSGLVGYDAADWFLKNNDLGKGQIPTLDAVTVVGYTTLAIKELTRRIETLEARP